MTTLIPTVTRIDAEAGLSGDHRDEATRPAASRPPTVFSMWPTYAALGLLVFIAFAPTWVVVELAVWPWLIGLLIFGMSHGAADYMVNNAERRRRGEVAGLLGFGSYLTVMALCVIALVIWPVVMAVGFLLLTAIHFGQADLVDAAGTVRPQAKLSERLMRMAVVIGRGGLVVFLPFAHDPVAAWAPFALITSQPLAAEFVESISLSSAVLGAVFFLVVLGLVGAGRVIEGRKSRTRFVVETIAVAGVLWCAPPLLAVGFYFLFIHAPKHIKRLMAYLPSQEKLLGTNSNGLAVRDQRGGEENPDQPGRRLIRDLWRVHWVGWPLWLGAIVMVLSYAVWLASQPNRVVDNGPLYTLASASIGFYIISTLPHHLLGLRLKH